MTAASDTLQALGGEQMHKLKSRSLRLSRFSQPNLKDDPRKDFFIAAIGIPPFKERSPLERWQLWLEKDLKLGAESLLFAKLNSRLLLHMSGGTMENASILLDRYGYPYIPGSGVKGTTRHTILAAIREWAVVQEGKTLDASHPFQCLTQGYHTPEAMLADFLMAFGWTDGEWKDGRAGKEKKLISDCEYALGENWKTKKHEVAALLKDRYAVKLNSKGIPDLSHIGRVAFFQAYPCAAGYPDKDLEVDVLTPHHTAYYAGDASMPVALDVENPIPVYFPSVKAGITFVFAIQSNDERLRKLAHAGLSVALGLFGTGAKTNAGYGWFDTQSEQAKYVSKREKEEREQEERRREQERLERMKPEDIEKERLLKLDDQKFAELAKGLTQESELTQRVLLNLVLSGQKRDRWKAWKKKKPEIVKSITEVAKQLNITLP